MNGVWKMPGKGVPANRADAKLKTLKNRGKRMETEADQSHTQPWLSTASAE